MAEYVILALIEHYEAQKRQRAEQMALKQYLRDYSNVFNMGEWVFFRHYRSVYIHYLAIYCHFKFFHVKNPILPIYLFFKCRALFFPCF